MITTFYITTAVLAVLLATVAVFELLYHRGLADAALKLRRWSFVTFYTLFLAATVSRFFTVDGDQIEMMPTMTICLDYCAFVAFAMQGMAYFGRKHYQNPYNWFFMLELPVGVILLNILMRVTGSYRTFYSPADVTLPAGDSGERLIFLTRIIMQVLIVMCYIFLLVLLLESYIHNRRTANERMSNIEGKQYKSEHINILLYALLLVMTASSNFYNSVAYHIVCNVLMTVMVARSVVIFKRFADYAMMKANGSFTAAVIEDQLKGLLLVEHDNPLLESNTTLDDVAEALKVGRDELSDYIYNKLGLSFSAWISEKKLLFCAHMLATTDRMISDIALSAGYMNAPAMNKAFKAKFGTTPSQYRQQKH